MPSVLHVAHFDPPIHGEAMMAAQLRDLAKGWIGLRYQFINTVYSEDRGKLGSLSVRKACLLVRFLLGTVSRKIHYESDILLVHLPFHVGPFYKASLFLWLGWFLRMRVIAWVHMDPNRLKLESRPLWFRKWLHLTLNRVDLFVACAPSLPATWPEWLACRPNRAIANAIPDPLQGNEPAKPGCHTGRPLRVIYLSAIDTEKGWRDLYEVARRICDERIDVEFHFHGAIAGTESDEVVRKAFAFSGHPERIVYLGPVWGEEKIKRLRDADIFAFPSHTEQFPLAILEAMACGLPIVTSDVGAVRDALDTPEGGELVVAKSIDALKSALTRILDNPMHMAEMGRLNRLAFVNRFSPATFGDEWLNALCSPANPQREILG